MRPISSRRLGAVHCMLAAVGCIALAAPVLAAGAPSITLRFADAVPEKNPVSVYGSKFWMDTVTKLTDGKVAFQWYPAEQLGKGKDLLALALSGAVDIGSVGPSYTPDKLPLSAVAELPEMFGSACKGGKAYWSMVKPGGLLDKLEYAPKGLHVVFAFTNPPYEVQTVRHKVVLPGDMKGLKFKTLGGASDDSALLVGAVPVQMTVSDLFLGLKRGTVDGRFGAFSSVYANSTQDVLQYSTVGADIGGFGLIAFMGDQRWKALPPDVQAAMIKAGDATWENFCNYADTKTGAIAKDLADNHHWTNTVLTPEQEAAWRKMMDPVQEQWAKELDKRGLPGSQVLAAFRAAAQ
jgi:TRAP-type C4-dicarboxylate transport system substrate-binding protein